jgi:hypothetical protein
MAPFADSVRGFGTAAWTLALSVLVVSGCAATPYKFGRFHPKSPGAAAPQPVEVVYGKPRKTLDRIAWMVGIPGKLLTLNKNTDNHQISPETVERLEVYLAENDITDVYVAVNEYDPKGQWRRMRKNDRISPFWRYSVGTLAWMHYTRKRPPGPLLTGPVG